MSTIPNRITVTIRVTSIRSLGQFGGVIFAGQVVDAQDNVQFANRHLVVKADHAVINVSVHKGEVWAVSGTLGRHMCDVNGYLREDDQVIAEKAHLVRPSGQNIIAALAGNPAFVGVGDVKARRLWAVFGEDLYRMLDDGDVDRLMRVLSPATAGNLVEQWRVCGPTSTLRWLDSLRIPRKIGQRIVTFYDDETRAKVEEDPYRLVAFEVKWRLLDDIARSAFHISADDPRRLAGALEQAIYRHLARKHTAVAVVDIEATLINLLSPCGKAHVDNAEARGLAAKAIASGVTNGAYIKSERNYHLAGVYLMEQHLAERFARMLVVPTLLIDDAIIQNVVDNVQVTTGHDLTGEQMAAVRLAAVSPLTIITGGAGVGRATVLRCVCDMLSAAGMKVIPLALSGRAARHMQESTGRAAMTIAAFTRRVNEDGLTNKQCVVIDEANVVDVLAMYAVVRKLPEGTRLLLIGDPEQIEPVGPGLVLHALSASDQLATAIARLTVVHRQEVPTGIPAVVAAIRSHEWPPLPAYSGQQDGVTFLRCDQREIANRAMDVYEEPGSDGSDVRILCCVRSTSTGTDALNLLVQERYRRNDAPLSYADIEGRTIRSGFKLHDRVMWTRNDYGRELMNGTLGRVVEVHPTLGSDGYLCVIDFDGARMQLTSEDMDDLVLAYAISIHTAQSSQFERVIIPVVAGPLLDQGLIYTAVTCGVRQVVLVGDEQAACEAVCAPARASRRQVGFTAMLNEILAG